MKDLKFKQNGAPDFTPTLAELAGSRPELANVQKIWSEALAPELARREANRSVNLNALKRRTILAAIIPAALVALVFAFTVGLFGGFVFVLILASVVSVAVFTGLDWLKFYAMKTATKDLVLGAACAPFGFTYQTLHPDVSGVTDFKSAVAMATSYATEQAEAAKSQPVGASVSVAGFTVSLGEATGMAPPTPAYGVLHQAQLLPGHASRKFEDLIEGTRAGAQFSLVEACLDSGGDDSSTVFQGLLFHVEYPRRFLGRTIVARSGWWKRGKGAKDLKKVDLVSAELNDAFTIYSTDQVEARALLTPDRMERLIELERHFRGGKLRAVFEDGHMTMALEAPDQFEAGSIFEPLVNPDRFATALVELGLVCDLIDGYLTRDWVKAKR
jgi:hypothetical protein